MSGGSRSGCAARHSTALDSATSTGLFPLRHPTDAAPPPPDPARAHRRAACSSQALVVVCHSQLAGWYENAGTSASQNPSCASSAVPLRHISPDKATVCLLLLLLHLGVPHHGTSLFLLFECTTNQSLTRAAHRGTDTRAGLLQTIPIQDTLQQSVVYSSQSAKSKSRYGSVGQQGGAAQHAKVARGCAQQRSALASCQIAAASAHRLHHAVGPRLAGHVHRLQLRRQRLHADKARQNARAG